MDVLAAVQFRHGSVTAKNQYPLKDRKHSGVHAPKQELDVDPMLNIREAMAWLQPSKMPALLDKESMLDGKEQAWHFLSEHLAQGGQVT